MKNFQRVLYIYLQIILLTANYNVNTFLERSMIMKKITVLFVLIFALAMFTACAPAAERPLDDNRDYNNNYGYTTDDGLTDNRTYDQVTPNETIPNTPNNTNYPNNMDMNNNNNLRTTP